LYLKKHTSIMYIFPSIADNYYRFYIPILNVFQISTGMFNRHRYWIRQSFKSVYSGNRPKTIILYFHTAHIIVARKHIVFQIPEKINEIIVRFRTYISGVLHTNLRSSTNRQSPELYAERCRQIRLINRRTWFTPHYTYIIVM